MVDMVSQLLGKHENSKVVMEKLFGQLVARDGKDNFGFDNMTAQLIQFEWLCRTSVIYARSYPIQTSSLIIKTIIGILGARKEVEF